MECFEIKWTEPCSLDSTSEFVINNEAGVYMICRTDTKPWQFWYIGQTKNFLQRIKQHRQQWSHALTSAQMNKLAVSFGMIHSIEENSSISIEEIRSDIEKFLLYYLKPKRNSLQTRKEYVSRPILIVNTGKLGIVNKIMTSNHRLLELLTKKQSIRKPRASKKSTTRGFLGNIVIH